MILRCRIALESNAGRFRIGGQPEDLFDLMNYTDQESCQMENCEDSFDSGKKGSSITRGQDRVEADESIIANDWSGNEDSSRIPAMKRTAETDGQLTRLKHYEKKAIQRYRGKQHHHKELPPRTDTSEPRLRIKSMRSKITRKNHRGVVPNRYLNGDSEKPNETIGSAVCSPIKLKEKRISGRSMNFSANLLIIALHKVIHNTYVFLQLAILLYYSGYSISTYLKCFNY